MTAHITPLRPSSSPPPRSPMRAALAAAIRNRVAIEAELAEVNVAADRLRSSLFDEHRPSRRAAEEALEAAREGEPRRLVDEALGHKTTGPTVEGATAILAQAERRIADVDRALVLIGQEAERHQSEQRYAIARVDQALAAVLREASETAELIAEHYRILHRLHAIDAAIAVLPVDGRPPGFTYFLRPHHAPAALPDADVALVGAWRAAVDALVRDPDAALPPAPEPIRRVEHVIVDPPPAA